MLWFFHGYDFMASACFFAKVSTRMESSLLRWALAHFEYQKEYRTAEHRTPNFEGMYPYTGVDKTSGFNKISPLNYFIIRYWVFDIRYLITSPQ